MLSIRNVEKAFGSLKALDGVSLEIAKDSIVGLIGPNGSGKTTLFNIVSGFSVNDGGEIYFRDERIDGLAPNQIAHKGLCRSFQISRAPERLTVLENMLLAAKRQVGETPFSAMFMRAKMRESERASLERALELLDTLQLTQVRNEYAGELSGGQRKLLSLGRMFMSDPAMILLDEPTAGVNPTLTKELVKVIERLQEREKKTFFIIEHSMKVISDVCDRVCVLNFGRKIAEGTPAAIQHDKQVLEAYLSGAVPERG